jgi:MYXO-CTERM domain-containing protein
MMLRLLFSGLFLAVVLAATPALAKTGYTFKYDQYSLNPATAATEIAAEPLSVQAGFVKGEGFGQIYRPTPSMFPVELLGVDIFVAGPPNLLKSSAHANIEVWFHDGLDANPDQEAPDFVLRTRDVMDSGSGNLGAPLKGGSVMSFDFDWSTEEGHPAVINSGAFTILVRFDEDAADLSEEWGTFQCIQAPDLGACGCQQVGVPADKAVTVNSNVIHVVSSGCGGSASNWIYSDKAGIAGDFIIRVRSNVAQNCVPNCSGGKNCGLDGCGGTCGSCEEGWSCTLGICEEDDICQPACTGKDCGSDGCGGTCGFCDEGEDCQAGACLTLDTDTLSEDTFLPEEDTLAPEDTFGTDACVPDCEDKTCGSDGCGGQCGACEGDFVCQAGACVDASEVLVPEILSVSPGTVYNNVNTKISVTGKNFGTVKLVKLGAVDLFNPVTISAGLIEATVPEGVDPGYYDVIAVFEDDQTAVLYNGLEVAKKGGGGGGGCAASPEANPALPLLLLALAALALARRKLA